MVCYIKTKLSRIRINKTICKNKDVSSRLLENNDVDRVIKVNASVYYTLIETSIGSHESNERLNCVAVHPFTSWPLIMNQSWVVLSMTGLIVPNAIVS